MELVSSVTPACAHKASAADIAVCKSLPVQAPSIHVVALEMNCGLEQRQASSVEEQLPKEVELVAVRHGRAQVGRLNCLRDNSDAEVEPATAAAAKRSAKERIAKSDAARIDI